MYVEPIYYYVQGRFEKKTDPLYKDFRDYKYKKSIINDTYEKKFAVSVCGVAVLHDKPVIIFPKGYNLKGKDIIGEAKLMLHTFTQYLSDKKNEWEKVRIQENWTENTAENGLAEVLYILEDYRHNGYIVRKHSRISQKYYGRVLWSKTMQRTQPVFSHRQVIYPEPYMKSEVRTRKELIQKIHRYLVCRFRSIWGWLYDDDFAVSRVPEAPCTDETAVEVLKAELSQTFVQREIELMRSMLRYFQKKTGNQSVQTSELMLTFDFHWIWEHICGEVLGNVYKQVESTLIPQPVFKGIETHNIGGQIPDIICIRNKRLYVLDAKYYNHWNNIPGWPDYTKQFFYFYTIKELLANLPLALSKWEGMKAVANVLLLPESMLEETYPKYLGTVSMPWCTSLGNIQMFLLDIREMMQAYLDRSKCQGVQTKIFTAIDQKQLEFNKK